MAKNNRCLYLILILTLALGTFVIHYHAARTPTYAIDSYFYLSKAKQLAEGNGLRTTWNDGIDTKYFHGYSIFLALPFLLGFSYIPLQLVLYLLCAILLLSIAMELEFDPAVGILAATVFAANPIVIKWFSLPMAEGLALALSLLSVRIFLGFIRTKNLLLLFAACMVGGIAAITRAESLFLFAVFGVLAFPERKTLAKAPLLAGAVVFVLPLFAYWLQLKTAVGRDPAYIAEFRRMFLRFDLLKNILYNIWVPFGFMHFPRGVSGIMEPIPSVLFGAVWIGLGGCVFVAGLAYSLFGRLGLRIRAVGLLFLAYAFVHSLWYYRYERFMLMAIPLAALVWAIAAWKFLLPSGRDGVGRFRMVVLVQALIVAAGIYWGNHYTSRHRDALQQDSSWLSFQKIAGEVNRLNVESGSAVLTDLGPHLAYYLDTHAYLDSRFRNYWRRAFSRKRTLEEMDKLEIELVVTKEDYEKWLESHKIPPEARNLFTHIETAFKDISIIRYSP